ncbi:putative bifunctional diguanylate cyclase/phosphodiesterase [Elstera litoralis]|uniref:putative bifunctional diguanylate cyclase/phosphodiesterase n=1 Tax=Elstera litoralis TaxID=552518 RepID=UPI000698C8E8|nr:GGDEF domain-containing protein [Elstera litoralis]
MLQISRCSLWQFVPDGSGIECKAYVDDPGVPNIVGTTLNAADFPEYFNEVRTHRLFISDNTLTDARLGSLLPYLEKAWIGAMLDAPIMIGGQNWGILCCEHRGGPRQWLVEEQSFVANLADCVAIAVSNLQRAQAEERLGQAEGRLRALLSTQEAPAAVITIDPLTQLPNRDALRLRLNDLVEERLGYAIICIDCDDLARVNDSLGHAAGDLALSMLAQRLDKHAVKFGMLARLRSDEFALLVPGVTAPSELEAIADVLLTEVRSPIIIAGHTLTQSISLGIALPERLEDDPDEVIRNAATAMRRAKEQGGGSFAHFNPTMRHQAVARLRLEADLVAALSRDELKLFFQPIMSLGDRRLVGFEGLVRWIHPTEGIIPPARFIEQAEESSLILDIGARLFQQACVESARWRRLLGDQAPTISVNLSARQFADPSLIRIIDTAMEATGVPGSALKLEVTETSILAHADLVLNQIHALRERGLAVVIDDFGTGYSSFSHLLQFPIDGLKIDRRFVSQIGHDRRSTAIVDAMITLARSLELNLVAEGIETPEVANYLTAHGCWGGQGYLFDRPLTAEAAMQRIELALPHVHTGT